MASDGVQWLPMVSDGVYWFLHFSIGAGWLRLIYVAFLVSVGFYGCLVLFIGFRYRRC